MAEGEEKPKSWRQRLMKVIEQLKSLQAGIKDPTGFMAVDGAKVAAVLRGIKRELDALAHLAEEGKIGGDSVD